eukprot:scaffold4735_cov104-Skeletonema_dohrnii-CCMP3373.AAC.9
MCMYINRSHQENLQLESHLQLNGSSFQTVVGGEAAAATKKRESSQDIHDDDERASNKIAKSG